SLQRHMWGIVFIWLAATRPDASCPLPSPLVALNHGRWAGAFAWVRTQTWCLAASTLMASIISRALLESGTCFFCVAAATAVMTFSPLGLAVASGWCAARAKARSFEMTRRRLIQGRPSREV